MDVTRSESDMSRSSHDVRSDDGRGPISESTKGRMATTDLPGYGRDICDHRSGLVVTSIRSEGRPHKAASDDHLWPAPTRSDGL